MANMDGTNSTLLFTNQKGPVGEQIYPLLAKIFDSAFSFAIELFRVKEEVTDVCIYKRNIILFT